MGWHCLDVEKSIARSKKDKLLKDTLWAGYAISIVKSTYRNGVYSAIVRDLETNEYTAEHILIDIDFEDSYGDCVSVCFKHLGIDSRYPKSYLKELQKLGVDIDGL